MTRVTRDIAKWLKVLERVAGIEPAYSAWKTSGTLRLYNIGVSLCFCGVHLRTLKRDTICSVLIDGPTMEKGN